MAIAVCGWLLATHLTAHAQQSAMPTLNNAADMPMAPLDFQGSDLCLSVAPWGSDSWGIEAARFRTDPGADTGPDGFRFITNQDAAYLYTKDTSSQWTLARYIQGNAWGPDTLCRQPVTWYAPPPVPLAQQQIDLSIDYIIDTAHLFTGDHSWLMIAVNLWFRDTSDTAKPLVIDLVLHMACNNAPDCGLRSFESDAAFHHML
ncbi:MAG: hypothetical protein AAFR22_17935, partial [Chloroflexota bacterium]